jgi:short-subunit dehydrogenase
MHGVTSNGFDLRNQFGIVTDASGGLGSAVSRVLVASGMKVILVARTNVALEKLARDIVIGGG